MHKPEVFQQCDGPMLTPPDIVTEREANFILECLRRYDLGRRRGSTDRGTPDVISLFQEDGSASLRLYRKLYRAWNPTISIDDAREFGEGR